MRIRLIALMTMLCALACATTPSLAQDTGAASPPRAIGNQANGLSYQPTPSEVAPRERAAGIQQNKDDEAAKNRDLEAIGKDALRGVGQNTESVPKMTNGQ